MGYKTENIIVLWQEGEMQSVEQVIKEQFPFMEAKKYAGDFTALIAQVNGSNLCKQAYQDGNWQRFSLNDEDELWEVLSSIEDEMLSLSKKLPTHRLVFIGVDCFGGMCYYQGSVVQDGQTIFQQGMTKDGHIPLLQQIWPSYHQFYFEPFTRDFFLKKGQISGRIERFTIAGLWLALRVDYPNRNTYYVDASDRTLIIRCYEAFYFYFEQLESGAIKVSGAIYQEENSILDQVADLINNSLLGMQYEIEVIYQGNGEKLLFRNGEK